MSTANGEALYLLASNQDRPTEYDLYFFPLSSGVSGMVKLDNVIGIATYQADQIIALIGKPDLYRIVTISTTDNRVERVLFEDAGPCYRITGLAYDADADRLVVATEEQIYQVTDQQMIDLCTYLPEMERREYDKDFHCFLGGKYVFINQSTFFASSLLQNGNAKRLHFANSGLTPDIRGFMTQNPDVQVSTNDDMVWDNQTIISSLLTQSSDVDIITLYAGAGLSAIKSKGFYADLSGSPILTSDVSMMYPPIQAALMDGERLSVYPRDMTVYCWLTDKNALRDMGYSPANATMTEWLAFVEDFARDFDADDATHALFPRGFTKQQLVNAVLLQYIAEYEPSGQLRLHDPVLKDLLERILKLPASVFLSNDSDGTSIDAYDTGLPPLFVVNAMLSPDGYVGFYEGYQPSYAAPPAFTDTPMLCSTLSVYLVNPYSKNKETAIAFLEYCAQHTPLIKRFYMAEGFNQAIPNQEFADLKDRTTQEIADLTARLDPASREARTLMEDELAGLQITLAYAAQHEWLVSEADIAAYRKIAPYITFLTETLCFTDSSYSVANIDLYEMVDRLVAKSISVERFLAVLEQKYGMMLLENE